VFKAKFAPVAAKALFMLANPELYGTTVGGTTMQVTDGKITDGISPLSFMVITQS